VIAPTTSSPQLEVLEGGVGVVLAVERRRQGLSVEQVAAATRIRAEHLLAIERDDLAALPGPIYARGYVRSYAAHLGLDPAPLVGRLPSPEPPARTSGRFLSLARLAPRVPPGVALTAPIVAAVGLILVLALFSAYALYELRSARLDGMPSAGPTAAVAPPIASPAPLPSIIPTASPAPAAAAPVSVAIRATELTWVQVTVDGKAANGPSGHLLQPGAEASFSGQKVKIQAGKPSLLISVGGSDYAPLGVLAKEYSAQT
jgi:cytoskeleton protein RodZ